MQHEQLIQLLRAALRRSQSSEWHNDDIQPSMRKKYDGDLLGNNIESIIETLEVLKPKEESSSRHLISPNPPQFQKMQIVRYASIHGDLVYDKKYRVEEVQFNSSYNSWEIKVSDGVIFFTKYFDESLFRPV